MKLARNLALVGVIPGLLSTVVVLAGCGSNEPTEIVNVGVQQLANAGDAADRECKIVLRELSRPSNGTGGFQTNGSNWVWQGVVDVDNLTAAASSVHVLYQYGSDPTWWDVEAIAQPAQNSDSTFTSFAVTLNEHLPGPGMSGTSLSTARVQVIPYVQTADGVRHFDHNRVVGAVDSYQLASGNSFTISNNAQFCPGDGTEVTQLHFSADGTIEQSEILLAGGKLQISYDLDRLNACRGTHNGYPAWDIIAYARFHPSFTLQQVSLRGFETINGFPTSTVYSIPAVFDIPADTVNADLWFENTGLWCHGWDSNYGNNYGFVVGREPLWVGNPVYRFSRDTSDTCDFGSSADNSFNFDTWVRERAAMRNVCFEVWQPGLTDVDDPGNLWKRVDVTVSYQIADGQWITESLPFDRRKQNNARYIWDVRNVDPFRPYQCSNVTTYADGQYVSADIKYFFTVNGKELRPGDANSTYTGKFSQYPDAPSYCGQ